MKNHQILLLLAFLSSSIYGQQTQLWLEGEVSGETILEDGFEDMTLTPFTSSGNMPWTVNQDDASEGLFSAISGESTLLAGSSIHLNVDIPPSTLAVLTFDAKSNVSGSFNRLLIDDVELFSFDPIGHWESFEVELTPGNHDIEWRHGAIGSARLRLDNVRIVTEAHGIVRIQDGNEGEGKILVSDTFGNARWQDTKTENHKIGDLAHGGIVFYVNTEGTHGLVAAKMDQYDNVDWHNAHDELNSPDRHDAEGEKYFDWRLPSRWELSKMWENLHRNGCSLDNTTCATSLGGFAEDSYWSSTQFDTTVAWSQNFVTGFQLGNLKNVSFNVRAIRAF